MFTYHQFSGDIEDFKGARYTGSYAGRGEGKNNPSLQDVRAGCRWNPAAKLWIPVDGLTPNDWGPLCRGIYTMQSPVDTETHGPYVIWLVPDPANDMFGRGGFGWHGDEIEHPGLASEGCICSAPTLRKLGWGSNDHRIQVIQ